MIDPYYNEDGITIYHGDCADVLPTLTAGSVDLVVTDPPYMIGSMSYGSVDSKTGTWADMMNSSMWFAAWYRSAGRLLRHDGAMWAFCNWRSIPVVMRAAVDAQMPVTSLLVWDKEWIGPGGHQGLRPSYEMVALFAQPEFVVPDRGLPDIWRHKVGSYKEHDHPATKPEGLVRKIISASGIRGGGLVVDPFLGSGTTAAAAKSLGLRCVGIEAEERYCELAANRLGQGVLSFDAA